MALLGTATCSRCGASFATGVSRCPFCGNNVDSPTKQADGPTATPPLGEASSLRPRPPIGVRKKKPNWVLPATAAAIILAGAGAILLLRRGGESARPAPQPSAVVTPVVTAEPTQSELPFPDPARVDPSDRPRRPSTPRSTRRARSGRTSPGRAAATAPRACRRGRGAGSTPPTRCRSCNRRRR